MKTLRANRHGRISGATVRSSLVFLAAFGIALAAILYRRRLSAQPSFEEANVAVHLLRGDGFASPFFMSPGAAPPSAYCPPLYPLMIAGCYGISSQHGGLLLLLINSLAMAVLAVCLYRLGTCYASSGVGIAAALLTSLYPSFLFYSGDFWDAIVALAMFACLLCCVCQPFARKPLVKSGALGAAMGLLALTNPSYALAFPLILSVSLRGSDWRAKTKGFLAALLGGMLLLAPWTLRNINIFHRLYFIRDELNFELFEGNPVFATGWMGPELRDGNLFSNSAQRQILLSLGEPRYFDLCGEKFAEAYKSDPLAFWHRTARRMVYVFISDPTAAQLNFPLLADIRIHGIVIDRLLLNSIVAIGGIAGAWTAWRLRLGCTWIFFAGLLTTVPFVSCTVDDRYVLPFRAILIWFTALLLWSTSARVTRGMWPVRERRAAGRHASANG